MRHLAAALLCCALLGSALLVGSPERAEAQSATDQAIVEESRSWIGTPYGVYGFTCSGFTSMVYGEFGVYLPADPASQYSYGGHPPERRETCCSSMSQAMASPTLP